MTETKQAQDKVNGEVGVPAKRVEVEYAGFADSMHRIVLRKGDAVWTLRLSPRLDCTPEERYLSIVVDSINDGLGQLDEMIAATQSSSGTRDDIS